MTTTTGVGQAQHVGPGRSSPPVDAGDAWENASTRSGAALSRQMRSGAVVQGRMRVYFVPASEAPTISPDWPKT